MANRKLGLLGAAWEICRKDARIELRTREITATAGVFAVVVCVLASMAYVVNKGFHRATAAGTIWIALLFASVLSFSRMWQREREESALTGLLVSPIPRAAIFVGKALASFFTITVIAVPLVTLSLFLFAIDFTPPEGAPAAALEPRGNTILAFVGMVLLGILAISLIGTLFGAMTVRTRARDLVLAVVVFPVLSPVLVCGVAGTRSTFETKAFEDYGAFLSLLALFVVVGLAMGIALFGALVDDG